MASSVSGVPQATPCQLRRLSPACPSLPHQEALSFPRCQFLACASALGEAGLLRWLVWEPSTERVFRSSKALPLLHQATAAGPVPVPHPEPLPLALGLWETSAGPAAGDAQGRGHRLVGLVTQKSLLIN